MKIDRSRIRVVRQLEAGDVAYPVIGLVMGFGAHEFEAWPNSAYTEAILAAWTDGRVEPGSEDEDRILGWIEHQFLVEELPKLSAHRRIAMVRDGLLVPDIPRPGI